MTGCIGICILSLAHGSEQIQPGYVPLDGLCLEFFGDFSDFFEGGLLGKSFIGNI